MSVITGDRHLSPHTFHPTETSVSIAPDAPQAAAYPAYQNALHELAQAIEWSHGSFSLILAHCNSPQVRHHVLQDLTQTCALSLKSIALEPSAELMFSSILQKLRRSSASPPANATNPASPAVPIAFSPAAFATAILETPIAPGAGDLAGNLADEFVSHAMGGAIAVSNSPIDPDLEQTLAQSNAITISGFETVLNIEKLLASADIIRDELRKVFHCPLVWWVNDEILIKLMRNAPNIHSWFTSVEFPGAEFVSAEAIGIDLIGAELASAELNDAEAIGTELASAELNGAEAMNAIKTPDVTGVNLENLEAILPASVSNSEPTARVEMMFEVA